MPAVALLGPRQVGKTTLALELAERRPSIYLDLESDADRARLAEPELYWPSIRTNWLSSTRSTGYRTCSRTCAG
ncbi:AAA family ATPase [Mesorhizobium sp. LMG 17147]|nr:AAA family ATPase [Mesorhizobium sp. LMG 17147]MCP9231774.1 AAA family ATPase [Mesorhizobium sp. LMG 17147]